jgi:hypothetical protein
LAAIPATQAHALADRVIPNGHTLAESEGCAPPARANAGRFQILERLSALSPRHKVSLALAPLAIIATVFASSPRHPKQPTPERRAPAAKRLETDAPTVVPSVSPPTRRLPAPQASAIATRTRSQKTLLRQAADSIAEGNYANARSQLAELQASDPNNASYGAALRIIDRSLANPR